MNSVWQSGFNKGYHAGLQEGARRAACPNQQHEARAQHEQTQQSQRGCWPHEQCDYANYATYANGNVGYIVPMARLPMPTSCIRPVLLFDLCGTLISPSVRVRPYIDRLWSLTVRRSASRSRPTSPAYLAGLPSGV